MPELFLRRHLRCYFLSSFLLGNAVPLHEPFFLNFFLACDDDDFVKKGGKSGFYRQGRLGHENFVGAFLPESLDDLPFFLQDSGVDEVVEETALLFIRKYDGSQTGPANCLIRAKNIEAKTRDDLFPDKSAGPHEAVGDFVSRVNITPSRFEGPGHQGFSRGDSSRQGDNQQRRTFQPGLLCFKLLHGRTVISEDGKEQEIELFFLGFCGDKGEVFVETDSHPLFLPFLVRLFEANSDPSQIELDFLSFCKFFREVDHEVEL